MYENGNQIDDKRTKTEVCVFGTFFADFWMPFFQKPFKTGYPFRSHFKPKVEKMHPENDAKIDAGKVS